MKITHLRIPRLKGNSIIGEDHHYITEFTESEARSMWAALMIASASGPALPGGLQELYDHFEGEFKE